MCVPNCSFIISKFYANIDVFFFKVLSFISVSLQNGKVFMVLKESRKSILLKLAFINMEPVHILRFA